MRQLRTWDEAARAVVPDKTLRFDGGVERLKDHAQTLAGLVVGDADRGDCVRVGPRDILDGVDPLLLDVLQLLAKHSEGERRPLESEGPILLTSQKTFHSFSHCEVVDFRVLTKLRKSRSLAPKLRWAASSLLRALPESAPWYMADSAL